MEKEINGTWLNFLSLASYSFLAIGMEIVLIILVEPLFFDTNVIDITTAHAVFHWIASIIIWWILAYYLTKRSINKYDFNFLKERKKMNKKEWGISIGILLILFIASLVSWEGFKIVQEFQYLGLFKFILQYAYYFMEALLVLMIIIFAQKAGELRFKKPNVPWGGIFVGLTWGMVNTMVQGSSIAGIIGLFYGMLYLIAHKNFRISYFLVAIAFVI